MRRFFVVKGYEEVARFFHIYRGTKATKPALYTGDFDTMYTTIDHADLILRIRECVEEAFSYQASVEGISEANIHLLWLVVKKMGKTFEAEWNYVRRIPQEPYSRVKWFLSVDSLTEMVTFIVNNTYLLDGGVMSRQTIGIPMGTNAGPVLANLYLYRYESTFVDRARAGASLDAARLFRDTFRLIDTTHVLNIHTQKLGITRTGTVSA